MFLFGHLLRPALSSTGTCATSCNLEVKLCLFATFVSKHFVILEHHETKVWTHQLTSNWYSNFVLFKVEDSWCSCYCSSISKSLLLAPLSVADMLLS